MSNHTNTRGLASADTSTRPTSSDKRAYSINEFSRCYSISRSHVYVLHKLGKLPFVKVGGRTLIRHDDAEALLRGGA
jgi:excisionase family DNA binding protein